MSHFVNALSANDPSTARRGQVREQSGTEQSCNAEGRANRSNAATCDGRLRREREYYAREISIWTPTPSTSANTSSLQTSPNVSNAWAYRSVASMSGGALAKPGNQH